VRGAQHPAQDDQRHVLRAGIHSQAASYFRPRDSTLRFNSGRGLSPQQRRHVTLKALSHKSCLLDNPA
jgi:hypothetical protein